MTDGHLTENDLYLEERYGRRRTPLRRRRAVVIGIVATALLGVAVVVWVAVGLARVPVSTQDVGFSVIDETAVDVRFVVMRDPAATVRCRVHALSPSFAEVGVRDVLVGPSRDASVLVTTRVATSERATTGLVQRCSVVAGP